MVQITKSLRASVVATCIALGAGACFADEPTNERPSELEVSTTMALRSSLLEVFQAEGDDSTNYVIITQLRPFADLHCGYLAKVDSEPGPTQEVAGTPFSVRMNGDEFTLNSIEIGEDAITPAGVCPPALALSDELDNRVRGELERRRIFTSDDEVRWMGITSRDATDLVYGSSDEPTQIEYKMLTNCGVSFGWLEVAFNPAHERWDDLTVSDPHLLDANGTCSPERN